MHLKRLRLRKALAVYVIPGFLLWVEAFACHAATLERAPIILHYTEGQEALALDTMEELHEGLLVYGWRMPAGDMPIDVTICATLEDFNALSGGVPAMRISGFARSREGIIVLKAPGLLGPTSNFSAIVRHELLHVLLARNTDPDHLPRWLNEGIAMILSRESRLSSMFSMARIYTGGRVIDYEDLPHVFNAPGNETEFGDAYVQSLSMTRYLRTQMGEERFWIVVQDLRFDTFENALHKWQGLTPEAFFDAWRDSLWRNALLSSLVTGLSIFQIAALLLVAAFFRKRARNRRLIESWIEDEEIPNEE